MRKLIIILAVFYWSTVPAFAEELPACTKTGAKSVYFNGKPAVKLGDVTTCPAGSYEIIPNVIIEGQPLVHFNTGVAGCVSGASPHVVVDGKAVTTAGDVDCQ